MCLFFFFFKQKTAYEMRIIDWSSDVCSSDLLRPVRRIASRPVASASGRARGTAGRAGVPDRLFGRRDRDADPGGAGVARDAARAAVMGCGRWAVDARVADRTLREHLVHGIADRQSGAAGAARRSEEHTSDIQS